jgi:hypothetical protein
MKIRQQKWLLLVGTLFTSWAFAASSGVLIKNETLYAKPAVRSAAVGKVARGTPVTVVRAVGWKGPADAHAAGCACSRYVAVSVAAVVRPPNW